MEAIIVGAGIGGLTLALTLHEAGIASRVFESASEIKPVGVGINILPHASRELCRLGLEDALARLAVTTRESVFFNRFGQRIYSEPAGRYAGYDWPQFSIHRGDLQQVLLEAFKQRVGAERLFTGYRCIGFEQSDSSVRAALSTPKAAARRPSAKAMSSSRATACTRSSASSSTRRKASRCIPASTCGVGLPAGSPFSPGQA